MKRVKRTFRMKELGCYIRTKSTVLEGNGIKWNGIEWSGIEWSGIEHRYHVLSMSDLYGDLQMAVW